MSAPLLAASVIRRVSGLSILVANEERDMSPTLGHWESHLRRPQEHLILYGRGAGA